MIRYHTAHVAESLQTNVWSFDFLAGLTLLLAAGAYLYVLGPLRTRFALGPDPEWWRPAMFLSGLLAFAGAIFSPIDYIGEHFLFSMHMVQHLIMFFIVPVGILLGTPGWMIDLVLRLPGTMRVGRVVTNPVVAIGVSQGVVAVWHVPAFYETALANRIVHDLEHGSYIAVSLMMWWPLLSQSRRLPPIRPVFQIFYLFVLPVPQSLFGAILTFADGPVYQVYADAPRVFALSAADDQQLGGLLMWTPGKVIFWFVLAIVFFRWFGAERRRDNLELRNQLEQRPGFN
ncbi:MAG: cytochrome c oxidase assembly protein [Chloroflexota bacterium]|nr:cytochrome c oxidase assembly protein [Chloroflexota bacterium]